MSRPAGDPAGRLLLLVVSWVIQHVVRTGDRPRTYFAKVRSDCENVRTPSLKGSGGRDKI